jgi:beta-phosphoglucomutase-like phosphatase (HAD superfamily)
MKAKQPCSLAEVVARTRYLLLDFDGPICSVFASLPASTVATELCRLLEENGEDLPPHTDNCDDPFEVLHLAAVQGPALVERLDSALQASELIAIKGAQPTPYAREVLLACSQTGRPVAVVSNNPKSIIEAYLTERQLIQYVQTIVGRSSSDPRLLKPSPYPTLRSIHLLKADPQACTLVGDAPSDIASARAAGIRSIGYANKPGKNERLNMAGADVVIFTMSQLASALLERPLRT